MKYGIGRDGFIKGFAWLLIFCLFLYVGLSFARPYLHYYKLSSNTQNLLEIGVTGDAAIKTGIMELAEDLNIQIPKENIEVTKRGRNIVVSAFWSETVKFGDVYQKRLDFEMVEKY